MPRGPSYDNSGERYTEVGSSNLDDMSTSNITNKSFSESSRPRSQDRHWLVSYMYLVEASFVANVAPSCRDKVPKCALSALTALFDW